MEQWAELAREGKTVLLRGDQTRLAELIDANFDLRRRMCRLNPHHVEMVETARSVGCSAKYCGSGGAIIGTYADEAVYTRLVSTMHSIGCIVVKPQIR
jgi:glucuronokinase